MSEVELARDEAANQWLDANVQPRIREQLRSWARSILFEHDQDDCANAGVIIFDAHELRAVHGGPMIRAYAYGLILQWDDGRKAMVFRAALRTSDSNEVVEFIPVVED